MYYLYHIVPQKIIGTKLVPLHELKNINQPLYLRYVAKYLGREDVPKQRIPPPLDCLWNDVIFLMAIKPQDLLKTFTTVGAALHKRRYYRIDARQLDSSQMTVCLFGDNEKAEKKFVPFRIEDIESYSQMPQRTIEYYREKIAAGLPKLMFAYVPHILFKGSIDISNVEIVEV